MISEVRSKLALPFGPDLNIGASSQPVLTSNLSRPGVSSSFSPFFPLPLSRGGRKAPPLVPSHPDSDHTSNNSQPHPQLAVHHGWTRLFTSLLTALSSSFFTKSSKTPPPQHPHVLDERLLVGFAAYNIVSPPRPTTATPINCSYAGSGAGVSPITHGGPQAP